MFICSVFRTFREQRSPKSEHPFFLKQRRGDSAVFAFMQDRMRTGELNSVVVDTLHECQRVYVSTTSVCIDDNEMSKQNDRELSYFIVRAERLS
jgi:hypothetical protein